MPNGISTDRQAITDIILLRHRVQPAWHARGGRRAFGQVATNESQNTRVRVTVPPEKNRARAFRVSLSCHPIHAMDLTVGHKRLSISAPSHMLRARLTCTWHALRRRESAAPKVHWQLTPWSQSGDPRSSRARPRRRGSWCSSSAWRQLFRMITTRTACS